MTENDDEAQPQRPMDPEKLLRLAATVREMAEEARRLDPKSTPNQHLADLHSRVTAQIKEALPEDLAQELETLDLGGSFTDGATGQEVRIALSGLVGWLQGLFQGLQAAMQVQAMTQRIKAAEAEPEEPDPSVQGRYL